MYDNVVNNEITGSTNKNYNMSRNLVTKKVYDFSIIVF